MLFKSNWIKDWDSSFYINRSMPLGTVFTSPKTRRGDSFSSGTNSYRLFKGILFSVSIFLVKHSNWFSLPEEHNDFYGARNCSCKMKSMRWKGNLRTYAWYVHFFMFVFIYLFIGTSILLKKSESVRASWVDQFSFCVGKSRVWWKKAYILAFFLFLIGCGWEI